MDQVYSNMNSQSEPDNPTSFRPFLDEFADPDLEREYRTHRLPSNWRRANFFAALMLPVLVLFGINDIRTQGWGPDLYGLSAIRGIWATISILLIVMGTKSKKPARLEFLVVLYLVAASIMEMYVVSQRPIDFMASYTTDIILVFAIYYLFPLTIRNRLFVSLIFSTGTMAVFYLFKVPAFPASAIAVPLAFAIANVISFYGALQFARARRMQFLHMKEEELVVKSLEKTFARLKTLGGLIPICAASKKVRDDDGFWKDIDNYISLHSEAEFTLGTCVDCAELDEAPRV